MTLQNRLARPTLETCDNPKDFLEVVSLDHAVYEFSDYRIKAFIMLDQCSRLIEAMSIDDIANEFMKLYRKEYSIETKKRVIKHLSNIVCSREMAKTYIAIRFKSGMIGSGVRIRDIEMDLKDPHLIGSLWI